MSTVWAAGDYHRFATELIWHFGPELVADTEIARGMRVLDVATGSGNVALRAAERGAVVTACDVTPEQLALGRREAEARGLEIEWVEADAQRLPFADDAFDVVTSAAGAIFAPDHRAVAGELRRVCRPGGTIGMINFTPEGLAADFFAVFAPYGPAQGDPPVLWGSEAYLAELFAGLELDLRRHDYVERVPGGPQGFVDFYRETFGPAAVIEDDRFEQDFRAFAERANEGAPGGDAELRFEYLRVLARLPRHPEAA
jgi:SAM-dependent methyltransferase